MSYIEETQVCVVGTSSSVPHGAIMSVTLFNLYTISKCELREGKADAASYTLIHFFYNSSDGNFNRDIIKKNKGFPEMKRLTYKFITRTRSFEPFGREQNLVVPREPAIWETGKFLDSIPFALSVIPFWFPLNYDLVKW